MRLKLLNLSFFINFINRSQDSFVKMNYKLHKDSFVGAWILKEEDEKNDVIHLQSQGSIYKTVNVNPTSYTEHIGMWEPIQEKDEFYFNIKDKGYYGRIINNSLMINGTVCEGKRSPCYITNFTLIPLFEQFHEIKYMNTNDNSTYLNKNNVTGTWMIENTNTNQINIIELFKNNTWTSIYGNKDILRGKWNLYNETENINTNIVSNMWGKNIWISMVPKKIYCYPDNDIMFLGKITQLSNINEYCQSPISSKINGTVAYCFEMEPEISEGFYMKRWFI